MFDSNRMLLSDFVNLINSSILNNSTKYVPHNIEKIDDKSFNFIFSVPGFNKNELSITHEDELLVVKGTKEKTEKQYLHQDFVIYNFVNKFTLPKGYEISNANLENGILTVSVYKNVEEKEIKNIEIN